MSEVMWKCFSTENSASPCPAMYELEYVRGHVEVFFNGEFCFSADNRREAEAELALLQR